MTIRPGPLRRAALLLLILAGLAGPSAAQDQRYLLASGPRQDRLHAIGVGLGALIKVELLPRRAIDLDPVSTAGAADSLRLLQAGRVQFALLPAMFAAARSTAPAGALPGTVPAELRAVASLWRDVVQLVLPAGRTASGTLADFLDLAGERVWLGRLDGDAIQAHRLMLLPFGLDLDRDFRVATMAEAAALEALRAGDLAGLALTGPASSRALRALLASAPDLRLLEVTPDQVAAIDGGGGLWLPHTLPAGTYPQQAAALRTLAQANLLVARADVDPAVVEAIAATIFAHPGFLRGVDEALLGLALDQALTGVPIPLHPGAERFYERAGLLAVRAIAEPEPPAPAAGRLHRRATL
jgi:hypothetical protein